MTAGGDGFGGGKWNENQRRAHANKIIWNKGLTKETDPRIRAFGESLSSTLSLTPRVAHNKGKTGGTSSQKGISKPHQCGDNNPAKRPEVRAKIREYWAKKKAGIAPACG
jgi:hypothetical protein